MPCLFRNAHHLGHWTKAASGGLNPDPAIRVREACSHLLSSTAAPSWYLHRHLLFAPSWRTIVGVAQSEKRRRVPKLGLWQLEDQLKKIVSRYVERVHERGLNGAGHFR